MLHRATSLFVLFALLSHAMMATLASVINPAAAAAGNKDRICLRSCKYVTVNAAGSHVEVSPMPTGSVSVTYDGRSTAAPAQVTAVADDGAPFAVVAVESAAPAANGALSRSDVHSFVVTFSVLGGIMLAL